MSFRKVPVGKKFMDKRGGVSRFSVEVFLSQIAKKQRERTLLCFRKVLVLKKFCVVGCHDFVDLFCLTVPKKFVGEPCFSEMFWF